ncbi:hypothetical protein CYY_000345 [Polysphondylium violaceum]|uniref:COBW domain-containing protein n=1 Tax=Polysphondylium violaceum TaxID=133409 RepID=A0A8J4UX98_9MYCE|nr:hypothetical protein CYY_000345 [Polysphondylium violaceum]
MSETNNTIAKKVPVTLITGFLGSGKTTFLNYILNANHGKKIAVIQNEYGQSIGIETAMIVGADGSKVSEWLEFPNGCICCTVKDDFVKSIEDLLKKESKFDYILVESTGMGDPGQISSSLWLDEELESPIYLDGIITLVDAKHIEKNIEKAKTNTINDEIAHLDDGVQHYSTEVERQIAFADIILLNKIDLVDKQELSNVERLIKTINPMAKLIQTEKSVVPLDKVLDVNAYNPNIDLLQPYLNAKQHSHHHNEKDDSCATCQDNESATTKGIHNNAINTVCIIQEGNVNKTEFNRWIGGILWEEKKDCVFRVKGLLSIKDEPEKYILQGVYATFEVLPSGINWEKDEPRQNKLVLIGESLSQSELEESFKKLIK